MYQLQLLPVDPTAPLDPELLELMRGIYQQYTGSQVATAIKMVRMEIEEYRRLYNDTAQ